jgi:polyhydroxybutyrate depolymerase
VLTVVGILALAGSARAEFSLPSGLAYVWWDFETADFEDFQIDLDLHNDPAPQESRPGAPNPGLYLQVYQGHIGDVGFYLGLQTDVYRPKLGGQGKGLIFSRWKTRDVADARATADGWIESSGHEGDFIGIRRKYAWGKGKYRLRLTALDEDAQGVWYGFFILDYGTNREDYCGAIRFPKDSKSEQPRPRIKNGGGTWLEVYSHAKSLDDIPFWHVTVDGCYANQRQISAKKASSDYSQKIPNADVHFDPRNGTTHFRIGKGADRAHAKTRHVFAAPRENSKAEVQRLEPGDHTRTLQIGEAERKYLVHVPARKDPEQPAPVVLALHGAGMNGPMMAWMSGLDAKSDEAGFIVVYPSGTGHGNFLTWNSGGFAGPWAEGKPDDVAFIGQVLDDLATVASVDTRRVYACGMSNGAMMCYRLAAELSDRIAAIAPVAGTAAIEKPEPKRPVPVLHFHGTNDTLVPYQGPKKKLPAFITFHSVDESIETWVKLNGCNEKPAIDVLSRDGDEIKVTRTCYSGGRNGAEVVLVVIEGGGHTWPGRTVPVMRFLGKTARNISADDLIWEFFQKYKLP